MHLTLSIIMVKKGDLSDFEHDVVVCVRWPSLGTSQICRDFPAQPSLGITENFQTKKKYPVSW